MTPQEFADKMKEIFDKGDWDWEEIHSKGDDVMCEILRELGYGAGIDIYESWTRYHA